MFDDDEDDDIEEEDDDNEDEDTDDDDDSDDGDDDDSDDSDSETTEVSEQSWGERLKASIGGVLFGIVLFLGSFVVLWWNEGNLVANYVKYGFIRDNTIKADSASVNSANNGKLIHLQGKVAVTTPAKDTQFNFTLPNAVKLDRKVEMYQWVQKSKSKKKKKLGGGEKTVTTYSYSKQWSSSYNDSSNFKSKKARRKKRNPQMRVKSQSFTAKAAKLGAYNLSSSLIRQISKSEDVELTVSHFAANSPASIKDKLNESGNAKEKVLYFGNPDKPRVGDYKVSYKVVKPGLVSVIAKQNGSNLSDFYIKAAKKRVEILQDGTLSIDDVATSGEEGSKTMAWIMRLVGFIAMAVGIYLIFNPLVVLADVLPFLGSLLGFGIGLFAGVIAFALSIVTIAIAWLRFRPFISIPLLVIGIGGIVAYKMYGKKKKEKAA